MMNIELNILHDGGVVLISDAPLPSVVRRVEYYREQRLFMLVYKNEAQDEQLMDYEVPLEMTAPIEKSPNVIIYTLFDNHEPIGYKAPLVKVGELY